MSEEISFVRLAAQRSKRFRERNLIDLEQANFFGWATPIRRASVSCGSSRGYAGAKNFLLLLGCPSDCQRQTKRHCFLKSALMAKSKLTQNSVALAAFRRIVRTSRHSVISICFPRDRKGAFIVAITRLSRSIDDAKSIAPEPLGQAIYTTAGPKRKCEMRKAGRLCDRSFWDSGIDSFCMSSSLAPAENERKYERNPFLGFSYISLEIA